MNDDHDIDNANAIAVAVKALRALEALGLSEFELDEAFAHLRFKRDVLNLVLGWRDLGAPHAH